MKHLLLLLLLLSYSSLFAQTSDKEKVLMITDYLIKNEKKSAKQARNEALATVYGKPLFKDLTYDPSSEMYFATVKTSKGDLSKKVSFYMPKDRAYSFSKNSDEGTLLLAHKLKDNEVSLTGIELEYKGVVYPMALKSDTSMKLELGGYFIANQDTEIYVKNSGVGLNLNLQEVLDLKQETNVFKMAFAYEFSHNHEIEFSYYGVESRNSKYVELPDFGKFQNISGEGSIIYDTTVLKFTYIYSLYSTNKLEINLRGGIHYTQFTTKLTINGSVNGNSGETTLIDLSVPAPLPVIGLGLNYDITDSLNLLYRTDYFYLSKGITGSMVDTKISLEYMFNNYIGLGLGFNNTKLDINTKVDETTFGLSHDVAGVEGSIIFKY